MQTSYAPVVIILSALSLAACSSNNDPAVKPTRLQSSGQLQKDTRAPNAYIYRAPNINIAKYTALMVEPTFVYSGPEASFSDFTAADLLKFSQVVTEEFRKTLGEKYIMTNTAAANVIRIRPTLIGVEKTVGGLATATRIIPIGLAINAVRAGSGSEGGGSMTGGIELALEMFDGGTNDLLASTVRQQSPAVFDMEATLSTEDTVRASARSLAETLRDAIGRNAPQMPRRADAGGQPTSVAGFWAPSQQVAVAGSIKQ